jgi:DNA-directed RNA polymerase subunit RPC12/RpoP
MGNGKAVTRNIVCLKCGNIFDIEEYDTAEIRRCPLPVERCGNVIVMPRGAYVPSIQHEEVDRELE